ncbi:metFprotein [Ferruginivarius sediminum]|uniref:Methylenetetrahydrofolate reductase n=2 Tax=Ferruginivarius sediminum TaxID=2661937 RepID=A0A369T983_9PROT|nr:metFprotein [Ferruginivarius sediminum]
MPAGRKQQIVDFVSDYSIETTPGSAAKTPDYREHLHEGTKVAVTFLPGSDYRDTVATAKRLREEGMEPAPHIAARSLKDKAQLEDYLTRLRNEAGITKVVVLAGAVDSPVGEFSDSMQLLDTGLFDAHGIKTIGVAGHPEGSPDIPEQAVWQALRWKQEFAKRTDAEMYICTQFVFEAQPVIDWDKAVRREGVDLPVHIGVPGLATLKTLINHARACGVGPSMRFLTRQAKNVTKLMTVNAPDLLVSDLAKYAAEDPDCGIKRVHMYPLGGMRRSAAWANAVAEGDFQMKADGRSFEVNRDIG